ncbi:MAG: gluconate 2-dehydrogenase subunit 3 family protein [Alphaproteobacteria bacterium]|nr:gluconate 2-dehydrogenase subunit 3 family protein [Alphaproteobacteria bacterium]MBU0792863.1 gluconate 2-dehydrogenase subunit 3 family protein [Alphaproteobacteria bacterium]MBU0876622.1 gluconate 2-dehydrogenase subunit 3 family protein [Alphaproteobacteria bacterium]MBU1769324.1 gluconate 2-dehydrogenase subunit 3 family protein [Alphaproteobacteria bacterium]
MSEGAPWDRRDFLGAATLLALCIGVPVATVRLSKLDEDDEPSERVRGMMADVAELVIPRTDTPGARDVGTGDFVILALAHGLSGTKAPVASGAITPALSSFMRRDGSLRYLPWLERTLDQAANGDFFRRTPAEREDILAKIDAAAMAPGAPWSPWVAIKGLVLTGYYTSQTGASQELRYELVPGRFDPDLPLRPSDRAWSSDWTAVEFG